MKKLQIPICGNAELTVWVTENMEKDLKECQSMVGEKDCDACSWWENEIGSIGLCDIVSKWEREK